MKIVAEFWWWAGAVTARLDASYAAFWWRAMQSISSIRSAEIG